MTKTKVLLIDDDPQVLELLEAIVLDLGYEPILARDGREGIERLDRFDFDLVVTDLWMPEVDGTQVVRTVMKKYPNLPVIVLSGSIPPNVRKDLEAHNCKAIVDKPLYAGPFTDLIERVVSQARHLMTSTPPKPAAETPERKSDTRTLHA